MGIKIPTFFDSHTVVKNHSNLMATAHVFLNFRLHFSPRTRQIYNILQRLSIQIRENPRCYFDKNLPIDNA